MRALESDIPESASWFQLTSCVTLGKFLKLSEPPFPQPKMGMVKIHLLCKCSEDSVNENIRHKGLSTLPGFAVITPCVISGAGGDFRHGKVLG